MFGRIVEIAEDGRYLHADRGFLVVESRGEKLGQVPLDDIAAVIANAHGLIYSNQLLVVLAEREVPFVVCANNHNPVAVLWPLVGHHRQAERMDAQLAAEKPLQKRLWQQIVRAKITWQAHALKSIAQPYAPLSALVTKVTSGDAKNVEAQAARRYWPLMMGKGFIRDTEGEGTNSLLNYGYAILRAATARGVLAAGLHPGIGLHHSSPYNAMRLVDDLMEPYRPLVDKVVWQLLQDGYNSVDKHTKRTLVHLLYQDFTTTYGTTPLLNCIQRLATSLAMVYLKKIKTLEIALPNAIKSGGE